jgi:hypothetical protein
MTVDTPNPSTNNDNTSINSENDNYLCGTMVKGHNGLFYLPVFELDHVLKTWVLDNNLEKSSKQKQAYIKFMDIIPVQTNYCIGTHGLDFIFLWTTGDYRRSIIDKPFGISQTSMKNHLQYFSSNCEGCRGYHKIVLSKEQYDCLLSILKI